MVVTQSPVITAALETAVRAPSPHNSQPWIFELAREVVDLVLDEDRILEVGDPDGREARLACGVFERDPLVAVLTTPSDGPLSQVRAMQRVLLAATDSGMSASFYSQPMEIPSTRGEFRAVLGGADHPQTVFRLGYGYPGVPTPRRSIDAVVRERRTSR